ncbi:metal ABC transporter ATP-binding protein [Actinomyces sp. 2119]|uniref:metal ABC transporter ATP-binding protein n=1 Tax=Actinomyces sp. 2119 TaxID=2321393 RepID=UPI002175F4F7|nr:ATP-binding cassette domain-containing protein [Actinomyces sp. 2119]
MRAAMPTRTGEDKGTSARTADNAGASAGQAARASAHRRHAHSSPLDASPDPVRVSRVSVVLGSAVVLDDVSLTVSPGESVALLGSNGSGKSTLVRTVLGLVPAASGTVQLMGADVSRRSRVPWDRVGYVPQRVTTSAGVPATALEVVGSGLLGPRHPWRDRGRRARQRAMDALEVVGLADRARDPVHVLSGGQAQRVLIARALVRDPDLLVLDEPLAGIDRASRESLASTLATLHQGGLTLVTVLHETGELTDIIGRRVLLSDGRVVPGSDPQERP